MILYLHGFHSGPASEKARLTRDYFAALGREDELLAPQLPVRPGEAMELILSLAAGRSGDDIGLIGSSLGGYYARWAAERLGCRAVLVNPAARPYLLLGSYLGWQEHPHTGERYEILPAHLDELLRLDVPAPTRPERLWLLTQTGDEVLDYREAVAALAGARQTVIPGGDHAFAGYAGWLPAIVRFLEHGA